MSARAAMSDIEAKRAARRAAMPITAAFVEQYAEFGATVIYASENGITVGREPKDESAFDIPHGYLPAFEPVKGRRVTAWKP